MFDYPKSFSPENSANRLLSREGIVVASERHSDEDILKLLGKIELKQTEDNERQEFHFHSGKRSRALHSIDFVVTSGVSNRKALYFLSLKRQHDAC